MKIKRTLLIVALVAFFVATLLVPFMAFAYDAPSAGHKINGKSAIAVTLRKPVSKEIKNLPADQNANYLTIFGTKGDKEFSQLTTAFREVPELKTIRNTTHYHVIETSSRDFRHYRKTIHSLPCVRLQRADGQILYEACGTSLPHNPAELAAELRTPCSEDCFPRWQKRRHPDPQPKDERPVDNSDESQPPTATPEPEQSPHHPLADLALLFGGVLFVATGLGCCVRFVNYVRGH